MTGMVDLQYPTPALEPKVYGEAEWCWLRQCTGKSGRDVGRGGNC